MRMARLHTKVRLGMGLFGFWSNSGLDSKTYMEIRVGLNLGCVTWTQPRLLSYLSIIYHSIYPLDWRGGLDLNLIINRIFIMRFHPWIFPMNQSFGQPLTSTSIPYTSHEFSMKTTSIDRTSQIAVEFSTIWSKVHTSWDSFSCTQLVFFWQNLAKRDKNKDLWGVGKEDKTRTCRWKVSLLRSKRNAKKE